MVSVEYRYITEANVVLNFRNWCQRHSSVLPDVQKKTTQLRLGSSTASLICSLRKKTQKHRKPSLARTKLSGQKTAIVLWEGYDGSAAKLEGTGDYVLPWNKISLRKQRFHSHESSGIALCKIHLCRVIDVHILLHTNWHSNCCTGGDHAKRVSLRVITMSSIMVYRILLCRVQRKTLHRS